MTTPSATPAPQHEPGPRGSRLATALTRRHNPLRRRSDVRRGRLRVLLTLALLVAGVLSALLSLGVYQHERAVAERQAAALHQVRATVLTDAAQPTPSAGADFRSDVRWTDSWGTVHQARVSISGTATAGSSVTLWLDSSDRPAMAPPGPANSLGKSLFIGMLVLVAADSTALAASGLARARLDRADLRAWGQEWQQVGPLWTGRG
jgi:hypothetical protein